MTKQRRRKNDLEPIGRTAKIAAKNRDKRKKEFDEKIKKLRDYQATKENTHYE